MGLSTDLVELRRKPLPFGTSIEIAVNSWVADKLRLKMDGAMRGASWDWYCWKKPRVRRFVKPLASDEIELPQVQNDPIPNEHPLDERWRRIRPDGYAEVLWHIDPADRGIGAKHGFACNGITLDTSRSRQLYSFSMDDGVGTHLSALHLSIVDPNASLPLTIRRDELRLRTLPFEGDLVKDIALDFIAYALACAPAGPLWEGSSTGEYAREYPRLALSDREPTWFCSEDGARQA